jgi:hypothetical protein
VKMKNGHVLPTEIPVSQSVAREKYAEYIIYDSLL